MALECLSQPIDTCCRLTCEGRCRPADTLAFGHPNQQTLLWTENEVCGRCDQRLNRTGVPLATLKQTTREHTCNTDSGVATEICCNLPRDKARAMCSYSSGIISGAWYMLGRRAALSSSSSPSSLSLWTCSAVLAACADSGLLTEDLRRCDDGLGGASCTNNVSSSATDTRSAYSKFLCEVAHKLCGQRLPTKYWHETIPQPYLIDLLAQQQWVEVIPTNADNVSGESFPI